MRSINGIFAACTVAMAALAFAFDQAAAALARVVTFVLSLFPPGPNMALAGGAFTLDRSSPGRSLDRALLNDMRHEANVSRRAADRHT